MALSAGDLIVKVTADMSQFNRDVTKDVTDTAGKVEQTFANTGKTIAKGLGTAFAVAGVGKFVSDSISAASDLNETMNKTTVVFGASAQEIINWSKTSASALGLSQNAALGAASGFGAMFTQLGMGSDLAAQNSTAVVQLATDLASFNNLPTQDVLDGLAGAFRGEYDSIQRVIPAISAAAVEQEALTETHKKSAKELTAAEKATAVLTIAQQQGALAANDFAETSSGVANATKIAQAQFENMQATIGQALLPVMADLLSAVTPLVQALGPMLSKAMQVLGPVIDGVVQGLMSFASFVQRNLSIIGPFAVAIGLIVVAMNAWALVFGVLRAATTAYIAVQTVLNAVMALNPIGLIVIAIAALVAGFLLLWKNVEGFRDFWVTAWGVIMDIVGVVWDFLKGVFESIVGAFTDVVNVIEPVWRTFWALLSLPVKVWWAIVSVIIQLAWVTIKAVFTTIYNFVKPIWETLWNFVSGVFRTWWGIVSPILNLVKTGIVGAFQFIWDKAKYIWDHITAVVKGAVSGIVGIAQGMWSGIKSTINFGIGLLNKAIRGFNKFIGVINRIPGVNISKIPEIPKLAAGGIVTKPTLALIGESGPEAVVPLRRRFVPVPRASAENGPIMNVENLVVRDDVDVQALGTRLGHLVVVGRL